MDETREERAARIVRDVLTKNALTGPSKLDRGSAPGTWRLTLYFPQFVEIDFEMQASDENVRRDLRKKLRDALGN